jgi:Papain-like cysteine protease AvrRpt2
MAGRRRSDLILESVVPVAVGCLIAGLLMRARANSAGSQLPQGLAFVEHVEPNLWVAGIPLARVEQLAAPETWGRQRRENWCWAAAIQMALNIAGLQVTQEQVVHRIYGRNIDCGGTPQQIVKALSGWAPTVTGKPARLHPVALKNYDELREDLSLAWPLVVGLRNTDGSCHAVVLTALFYSRGPNGGPLFQSVVILDPWPDNASVLEMPWMELIGRASFIVRNRVTYPQGV